MRSRQLLLLALLGAMLLPVAAAAQTAHEASAAREHPARRMWAELSLTPEQEAKFKEINARYAPARRENAKRIEELRAKINEELIRDKPARSLLVQYAGQMGELQKKVNLASVDHLLSVKAVLTPEQFKKFAGRASIGGGSGWRRQDAGSGGDSAEPDEE